VQYIGPILGNLRAPRVEWPQGAGPRIFACLRPDTSHAQVILSALAGMTARVICVANGFNAAQLAGIKKEHMLMLGQPLDLPSLSDADLCVTYGAEGTLLRFLLMGVPQLISPWHVESYMAARRIRAAGLGLWLSGEQTAQSTADIITTLAGDRELRGRTAIFATDHAEPGTQRAMSAVLRTLSSNREVRQSARVDDKSPRERMVAG
jgi:UDP:flavonoid glycosyltransferase YjiC (YdhE family)